MMSIYQLESALPKAGQRIPVFVTQLRQQLIQVSKLTSSCGILRSYSAPKMVNLRSSLTQAVSFHIKDSICLHDFKAD